MRNILKQNILAGFHYTKRFFKCSWQAIGIGSGGLVMLELLASANDWLLMLLTIKTQIKN